MTALIALHDGETVRILTDAALTRLTDGVLAKVRSKQIRLENGVVIAGAGTWQPCCRFAALADELANFDELADAAQDLWKQALAPMSAKDREAPGGLIVAGLSEKVGGPDMLVIEMPGSKLSDSAVAYAIGPHSNSREFTGRFLKRFADDPDAFDVRAEGLLVMEALRRHCPRHYEEAICPAIGGFIQLTTVTRDGIETEVLHHWPDRIGQSIDPDATADLETRDESFWGTTFAEVYRMRENLAAWPGLPAEAILPWPSGDERMRD